MKGPVYMCITVADLGAGARGLWPPPLLANAPTSGPISYYLSSGIMPPSSRQAFNNCSSQPEHLESDAWRWLVSIFTHLAFTPLQTMH